MATEVLAPRKSFDILAFYKSDYYYYYYYYNPNLIQFGPRIPENRPEIVPPPKPPLEIGRRKCAESSITRPWVMRF